MAKFELSYHELEDIFNQFKQEWFENPHIKVISSPNGLINTKEFKKLVAMGEIFNQFIIKDMNEDNAFIWNLVLNEITNLDLVPKSERGNSSKILKRWKSFAIDT